MILVGEKLDVKRLSGKYFVSRGVLFDAFGVGLTGQRRVSIALPA